MKPGDLAVIYHSGDMKAAVGLSKIISAAYKDPTSPDDWATVDLEAVKAFKKTVSLAEMKADKLLKAMTLVRNSRLSVSPLTKAEYNLLLKIGS